MAQDSYKKSRITDEEDASSDIGKRGAIAVSIIDDLYTIIERKQKLQVTENGKGKKRL